MAPIDNVQDAGLSFEEDLRYERKARISDLSYSQLEHQIRTHPKIFREIFSERTINNIYFDTLTLSSFAENVHGIQDRAKIRVRWYGEMFGRIEKPVLEVKFKTNQVGGKYRFQLDPFVFQSPFDGQRFFRYLRRQGVPGSIRASLESQEPRLLNRYSRRYFESQDRCFRITLDRHLTYFRLHSRNNFFLQKTQDRDIFVVEVKYATADDLHADEVCSQFSFLWTKNSKYVTGIEQLWWPSSL